MTTKVILPKPFLGRLLMEAIDDDIEEYIREKAGISKGSLIALPEDYKQKHSVPVGKGRIIDMAPDAFGEIFQNRYGMMIEVPKIGDIVSFIAGQSHRVDLDGKFHIISDEDVIAYFPKDNNEVKDHE